jgi:four helix bundle protein
VAVMGVIGGSGCSCMHDFKRLRVWQEARLLARDIHFLTRGFPRSDRKCLASQIVRSSRGIGDTIAEGCGKDARAETIRYLQMAAGSATETENHLITAVDLEFITQRAFTELTDRTVAIQRMLRSLCRNLP